jgi:hypothetical protein
VPGTDVIILNYFRRKIWRQNLATKWHFLLKILLAYAQNEHTIVNHEKPSFIRPKWGKNR